MPQQRVTANLDAVRLGEIDELIGGREVVHPLGRTDRVRLHRILGGDTAVVLAQQSSFGRRTQLRRFQGSANQKIPTVDRLQRRRSGRIRQCRCHGAAESVVLVLELADEPPPPPPPQAAINIEISSSAAVRVSNRTIIGIPQSLPLMYPCPATGMVIVVRNAAVLPLPAPQKLRRTAQRTDEYGSRAYPRVKKRCRSNGAWVPDLGQAFPQRALVSRAIRGPATGLPLSSG